MSHHAAAWTEYVESMRHVELDEIERQEKANPPRCESARILREGGPLAEALAVAHAIHDARTGGEPMPDMSDDAVFERAKDGHRRSAEIVLSKLRPRLIKAAQGKPAHLSPEDSDDVVQQVLLKLWEKLPTVKDQKALVPLALKMTRDASIDRARKNAVDAGLVAGSHDTLDQVLDGRQGNEEFGSLVSPGGFQQPRHDNGDNT